MQTTILRTFFIFFVVQSIVYGQTWVTYNNSNSILLNDNVKCLTVSPLNIVYMGTANGINSYFNGSWDADEGAFFYGGSNDIAEIYVDSFNDVWVGGELFGLYDYDVSPEYYDDCTGCDVQGITAYESKKPWTCNSDGVRYYEDDIWNELYMLGWQRFVELYCDSKHNIWGASETSGIAKIDTNLNITYYCCDTLPGKSGTCLAEDVLGNIWAGSSSLGLQKFDGTEWIIYDTSNSGLTDNVITSLAIDSANNKWVGTFTKGLFMYNDTSWIVYDTTNSEIPSNLINDIVIDKNDNVWISTGFNPAIFGVTGKGVSVLLRNPVDDIKDVPLETERIIITPNPNSGSFHLQVYLPETLNIQASIQIFTLTGKKIYENPFILKNGILSENISPNNASADGMYVAKIIVHDKIYNSTFYLSR